MQGNDTPRLVFPDTTVLINFALVDEMALLERLVAGNGSWCGTVASECHDQASKQGLPQMLDAHDIFGTPLLLETRVEFVDFKVNQSFFREVSENPDATHAGESETLAILTSRRIKSVVVSDDGGVPLRLAALKMQPTIQATTSWHFFRVAYWKGHISETRLWDIRRVLLAHRRACPPEVLDSARFASWIRPPETFSGSA